MDYNTTIRERSFQILNLKREYVRCALCGEDDTTVKYKLNTQGIRFSRVWINGIKHQVQGPEFLVSCKTCGLVYVNPRLPRPGIRTYSLEEEMAYFDGTRGARRAAFRDMLQQIPFWMGREARSLLDIGCGDGVLLEAARSKGIECIGTEISETLVRLVRARLGEHAILSGSLDDLRESGFDVVTLINVIEHVEDPSAVFKIAARLLKPDGVLLAHTPNLDGLPARLYGARWYHIEPFNHLYYFTHRTLAQMMQRNGLEPIGLFSLVISKGMKQAVQRLLTKGGICLDNGLGVVGRRVG